MTDAPYSELEIRLFGRFELVRDGEPLDPASLGRRKNQTLLKLLLSERGRVFTKDELVEQLFPNLDPAKAVANLYSRISKLRRVLEPDLARGNDSRFILRMGDGYCFNADVHCWIDTEAFQQALAQAREFHRAERWGNARQAYAKAQCFYRGDFLSEDRYEEWTLALRERWRGQYLNALECEAECCVQLGHFDAAIEICRTLLAEEPFNESAIAALMRAYAHQGDRDTAVASYHDYAASLREHLDANPSEKLQDLCRRIQRGELDASTQATPHNLPHALTPLIGRDKELAHLGALLQDPMCRLITLVGPGGIGKTKLAIEVARRQLATFSDGVFLVPLASVSTPNDLAHACADAIGASFHGPQSPTRQLIQILEAKSLLLVLDNFEHLLEGATLVSQVLRECPDVKALVTSRQPLDVTGEWHIPLDGLPIWPDNESSPTTKGEGALELFEHAARRAQGRFRLQDDDARTVSRICQQLDGLPLAIELAAAWTPLLSTRGIADRLDQSLEFLQASTRDVPTRHRSMRATFEHSWTMLTDDERDVLKRLSVFTGSFDAEAARAVAGASRSKLEALRTKSLIRRNEAGRYDLHELLRQYAQEKLENDAITTTETRDRHCRHYLSRLVDLHLRLKSSEQQDTLRRVEPDIHNIRDAWTWASQRDFQDRLRQTTKAFALLHDLRGWFAPADAILADALDLRRGWLSTDHDLSASEASLLADLYTCRGWFCFRLGRLDTAQSELEHGLALAEQTGDQPRIAYTLARLGICHHNRGDYETAHRYNDSCLQVYRKLDDRWNTMSTLARSGLLLNTVGRYADALNFYHEGLDLADALDDPRAKQHIRCYMGFTKLFLGNPTEAREDCQRACAAFEEVGDQYGIALSLAYQAEIENSEGQHGAARQLAERSATVFEEMGDEGGRVHALRLKGDALLRLGETDAAIGIYREALEVALETQKIPSLLDTLTGLADAHVQKGNSERATQILSHAIHHDASSAANRRRAWDLWIHIKAELSRETLRIIEGQSQPTASTHQSLLEVARRETRP